MLSFDIVSNLQHSTKPISVLKKTSIMLGLSSFLLIALTFSLYKTILIIFLEWTDLVSQKWGSHHLIRWIGLFEGIVFFRLGSFVFENFSNKKLTTWSMSLFKKNLNFLAFFTKFSCFQREQWENLYQSRRKTMKDHKVF